MEIWKPIKDWEEHYQVSNFGRIKSVKNNKNLIMSPANSHGYLQVCLKNKSTIKSYRVHRLVIAAFYGESDLQVDHINGVKTDNRLVNLRYVTPRQNITYAKEKSKLNDLMLGVKKVNDKYTSQIKIEGKTYHIGTFNSEKEAYESYIKSLHNWENCNELPKKFIPTSTYKGVCYYKRTNKWQATLYTENGKTHVGYFKTEELAIESLKELQQKTNHE